MFLHKKTILTVTIVTAFVFPAWAYDFGRPATPAEIKLRDIDVRPDGTGLPQGSGTVARGKGIYADNCEACHGADVKAESRIALSAERAVLCQVSP